MLQHAFLVLEYCDGGTLEEYVGEHGALSPHDTRHIARALLSALHTMHAASLLHRDVKASNILLCSNGATKLTDFGLSATLTSAAPLIVEASGTISYSSPERIMGEGEGVASDVWSAGVALYYCAAGNLPDGSACYWWQRSRSQSTSASESLTSSGSTSSLLNETSSVSSSSSSKVRSRFNGQLSTEDAASPVQASPSPDFMRIDEMCARLRENSSSSSTPLRSSSSSSQLPSISGASPTLASSPQQRWHDDDVEQFRSFLATCFARDPAKRATVAELQTHPFLCNDRFQNDGDDIDLPLPPTWACPRNRCILPPI
jgi:serine/threonine protein kinase